MASEEENKHDDVVAIELPAPSGWSKRFTPKKGGTPQRNDIVFISPTGEEIKNKRQLDQYLKSNPGGPAASEFDWGTGDTPRRSARLSEKSKAVVAPTSQSPKKKQRKSSTKGAQEKSNADADVKATDGKDATAEETKETIQVSIADAKDATDGEVITEGALPGKLNIEDVEKKTETEVALEEPSAVSPIDANTEKLNTDVEQSNDATTAVADAKIEESKETSSEVPGVKTDESKEASCEVPGAKNDEPKGACHAEKETPDGKVDSAATVVVDQDNPKEKQAEEKPVEKDPVLQEPTGGPPSLLKRFSYKDIKKATDGFKRVIDNSSQEASYMAKFQNGRVATVREVKIFDEDDDPFFREVQLLGRLHHRHIVALYGFSTGSKRFLIFENMEKGSLKDHLSDPLKTPLNWRTRLQIAIGVAAAVEYLHFFCDPPIYHVSISSSTILLDENLIPKISDISLFSAAGNHVTTLPTSSRCSKECTEEGCKNMIFQLGLVILELITGQSSNKGGVDLVQWVQELRFPRSIHKMIDPDLGNNYDPRELNGLLNVARLCIRSVDKPRIYTPQILWYLQKKIGITRK